MTSMNVRPLIAAALLQGPAVFSRLLAQVPTPAPEMVPQLSGNIANLTAGGVLIWYLWYTQSRSVPKMMSDYHTEQAAARGQFLGVMKELMANNATSLAEARVQFGEIIERERIYHNEQMELLRARVHDIANSSQQGTLKLCEAMHGLCEMTSKLERMIDARSPKGAA